MPIKSNNTAQSVVVTPQAMRESVSVAYPEMEGDLFLMESARLNREILTEATSILNEMENGNNGSTSSSSSDKDPSGSIGPSGKPNSSTPSISNTNPNSSNLGGK